MITTHATANYRDDLYAFLRSDRIEGFRQDPYFDSKGLVTIGVGFNIEGDRNVRRYVLNQLGVFAGQSDQEIENRQLEFEQIILGVTDGDEVDLVTKLNAKLREYLGAQTTTLFTLDTTQSRAIFEQILGDPTTGTATIGQAIIRDGKQKELDAILGNVLGGPSAHNTKEYVVLMSLYYNQQASNPLIGPNTKLMRALQQDNRAEAWYEIRYHSNGGASAGAGIANRRIEESNRFSLYDNAGLGVGEAEAKAVLRMYTTHRDAILDYESRFSTQFAASVTYTIQFQLIGAETTLIGTYAHGRTIDGEVLVGQDAAQERMAA